MGIIMEDLKELQIKLERIFSQREVEEEYKPQWYGILNPMVQDLLESTDKETIEKIINLSIHILYILSERESVMYHNLIEMCMSKSDRDDSIVFASIVLDLGNKYQLWKYDQLPVNDNALKVKRLYSVTDECNLALSRTMYKLPMVVEPGKVRDNSNNRGSGYILDTYDSLLLNGKWYSGDVCREYLDKVNKVGLCLNQDVLELFEHKLNLESIRQTVEMNNLANGTNTSPEKVIQQAQENWVLMINQTNLGKEILEDKVFYLTHKYDHRGRVYSQGVHFNYQGDTYCKAMIEFANKEVISDSVNFSL